MYNIIDEIVAPDDGSASGVDFRRAQLDVDMDVGVGEGLARALG